MAVALGLTAWFLIATLAISMVRAGARGDRLARGHAREHWPAAPSRDAGGHPGARADAPGRPRRPITGAPAPEPTEPVRTPEGHS
jgi:hypothetical protein